MTQPILSKDIPATASLEDLQRTKQEWLAFARESNYPEIMWEIVRWLGSPSPSSRRGDEDVLLFRVENLAIYGGEKIKTRDVANDRWVYIRSFSVCLCNGQKYTGHAADNEITEIIMTSEWVMQWGWFLAYEYDDNPKERREVARQEDLSKCSFINGEWVLAVRNYIGDAQAAKEKYNATNTDVERLGLLKELMAGVNL